MTLSNSLVSEKLQVRLTFCVMKLLYAIEGFKCSKDARRKENYFTAFSTTLAGMST